MYRLINTCEFKIDKITYSKWYLEQRMTLVKVNSCKGFIVSLLLIIDHAIFGS